MRRLLSFSAISFLVLLTGCATTKSKQNVEMQNMQNRIVFLEQELEKKEQEILNLEEQLQQERTASFDQVKKIEAGVKTKKHFNKSKKCEKKKCKKLSAKQIQQALQKAGFYQGPIDGHLGKQTRQAIKEFQKSNGLSADGIVGKRTARKLAEQLE